MLKSLRITGLSAMLLMIPSLDVVAVEVPADWFSNTTSVLNVIDPPGQAGPERLRLQEGFTTGFVEGTVVLPFEADWEIQADIRTDGQFDLPSEFVKIFIDDFSQGSEVAEFFNTPRATTYEFSHPINGSQFDYRFEFSSPSTNEGSHLIVQRGTVVVPEPTSLTLLLPGLAWVALRRDRTINRRLHG